MWRSVLGVAIGAVLWMVAFFTLAILLGQLWPEYAVHARDWLNDNVFTFTSAMAACNLVLWFVAEVFAGWLTMKIARSPGALFALIVLITGYLALMHLVLYWDRFPWWYNLGVVLPSAFGILLGGKAARRSTSRAAAAA